MLETTISIFRKKSFFRVMRSIPWFGFVLSTLLLFGEFRLHDLFTLSFFLVFAFFLLFSSLVVSLVRRERDVRPFIELRPEGLLARDISGNIIEWADIEDVQLTVIYGQVILNIELSETAEAILPLTATAQVSKLFNRFFGVRMASINLMGVDYDPEQLAGLISRQAEEGRADLDVLLPEDL